MNDADDDILASLHAAPGEVGLVEPRDWVTTEPFTFTNGQTIGGFTLRYETYGRPNAARDNAILVCHALSGHPPCAAIHSLNDRKPGWWNHLLRPASVNPATGRPFGITFPLVTIRDMVRAQKVWLDALGIPSLYAVIGGSMGGMQVLQWGIEFPGYAQRLIAMATTARESAQAIAFNEVGRQAIMQDPEWHHGAYPRGGGPRVGLAIARMMAHITYLSDASMDRKFGRRQVAARTASSTAVPAALAEAPVSAFDVQFEVESYLRYQGLSFINRFDANSYLYITRALDQFDLAAAHDSLETAFAPLESQTLVVGFTSDWLFPPEQNRSIATAMLRAGKRASYAELHTDLGHDSFLLESPQLYDLVRGFLAA